MDFAILELAVEVIDLRSFSNLWYWIVLAVMWSTLSHWCVGVPYDLVLRAKRGNEQAAHDMRVLAEVNANRLISVVESSGAFATAGATFMLAGLATYGWQFGNEFSQALFLLLFPLILVGFWSFRTARVLRSNNYEDVPAILRSHRVTVQAMGVVFIFVTAFWGMWVNVRIDPLLGVGT